MLSKNILAEDSNMKFVDSKNVMQAIPSAQSISDDLLGRREAGKRQSLRKLIVTFRFLIFTNYLSQMRDS